MYEQDNDIPGVDMTSCGCTISTVLVSFGVLLTQLNLHEPFFDLYKIFAVSDRTSVHRFGFERSKYFIQSF